MRNRLEVENLVWTDHILWQMQERVIQREVIMSILTEPDEIVSGKKGRLIYQKVFGDRIARAVLEGNHLITVYFTSKVRKYRTR